MVCGCFRNLEFGTSMTPIRFDISAVFRTKWHEYAVRFLFGGAITVSAGLIAKKFGPATGGLFLAFPAIFPASATLVSKHEEEKKSRVGLDGQTRGRLAAALDARGAAMGSLGLIAFALVVSSCLGGSSPSVVLAAAFLTWLGVSVSLWCGRRIVRT
jgi:hypothetical protein